MEYFNLDLLPKEIIGLILINLSYADIIRYCSTNTQALSVCQIPSFWQQKAYLDFKIPSNEFQNTNLIPEQRYIELLIKNSNTCVAGSEQFISVNLCLWRSSVSNNMTDVSPLINYFLGKGAGSTGNINLFDKLIEFDNKNLKLGLNKTLISVAGNGQLEMVKYLISPGDNNFKHQGVNNIDHPLRKAAQNGHLEIVQYFLNRGAGLNYALNGAAKGGHLELIKYLMERGARDLNKSLREAAGKEHLEVIKYLISKGQI